mmetsp:Transcript_82268/g.133517  ORF Transcript_82268/g.133517 Transcript_82268/m.133517 type:complete len:474 (+) Transcript_82268:147-1568(+)
MSSKFELSSLTGWSDLATWRLFCALDFAGWALKHMFLQKKMNVLTIAAPNCTEFPELHFVSANVVKKISEEESGGASVLQFLSTEGSFDLIVAPSLLHLVHDHMVILNQIRKHMKSGAFLLVGASTVDRMSMPFHFFHYMPMGLAAALMSAGFEVLELGQFGSWAHEQVLLKDLRTVSTTSISKMLKMGGGTILNEPARPDRVWALARIAQWSGSDNTQTSPTFNGIDTSRGRIIRHICFKPSHIISLWRQHGPNDPYFDQFKRIDIYFHEHPATQWVKSWMQRKEFSRVLCLLDFERWSKKYGYDKIDRLLATDHSDPELRFVKAQTIVTYQHQPKISGDLHYINDTNVYDLFFDFVLFSQTMEHLYDPMLCLVNLRNKMKTGGLIFSSVPTLNNQHMTPHHFFHYTPMGLIAIMESVGFLVLEIGQYGSWKFEHSVLGKLEWPDHTQFIHKGELDIDVKRPDNIWILARKV